MYLKKLRIRNFRNIANQVVDFSKGINVFIGNNAQGKSNLLEAVYFLSTGRSFRGSSIHELVSHNQSFFSLEAEIEKNNINEYLAIYYDGVKKKIVYNDTSFALFSQLLGILPSVILPPQDLQLIIGYPALRRRFINVHIAQCDPLYVHHLTRYTKAMKHRNALLKCKKIDGIDIFEEQMSISGTYLIEQRIKAINDLQQDFKQFYSELSLSKDLLKIKYLASCKTDEILFLLEKNRSKDLILKSTSCGPHRDELSLLLNSKLAKSFASEGQKRTILSALKFAEFKRLCSIYNEEAIFGVDDFGVHLDEVRKSLLLREITKLKQVIVTSPIDFDQPDINKKFLVENGNIKTF